MVPQNVGSLKYCDRNFYRFIVPMLIYLIRCHNLRWISKLFLSNGYKMHNKTLSKLNKYNNSVAQST